MLEAAINQKFAVLLLLVVAALDCVAGDAAEEKP